MFIFSSRNIFLPVIICVKLTWLEWIKRVVHIWVLRTLQTINTQRPKVNSRTQTYDVNWWLAAIVELKTFLTNLIHTHTHRPRHTDYTNYKKHREPHENLNVSNSNAMTIMMMIHFCVIVLFHILHVFLSHFVCIEEMTSEQCERWELWELWELSRVFVWVIGGDDCFCCRWNALNTQTSTAFNSYSLTQQSHTFLNISLNEY